MKTLTISIHLLDVVKHKDGGSYPPMYVAITEYKDGSISVNLFDHDLPLARVIHNQIIDAASG
jgi:hypothetical protein